jgi:hypothetical protein
MNERNDEKLRELLRSAVAPVADTELRQDLWPRMLRKLDESTTRVSWLDWALLAFLTVLFFLFPEVIPALLYHL